MGVTLQSITVTIGLVLTYLLLVMVNKGYPDTKTGTLNLVGVVPETAQVTSTENSTTITTNTATTITITNLATGQITVEIVGQ